MDVLIADDSEFVRSLLREILEEDYRIVGEAFGRTMRFDTATGRVVVERTDGVETVP